MGRKSRYETNVKPFLKLIPTWYATMTESQIAKKLGISVSSFEKYKNENQELRDALQTGKELLIEELKSALKMKAKGFTYTETKTTIRREGDRDVKTIEEFERYAQPDTGAIHLLLKNLDESWRNDDKATMEMKREQLEIAKKKAENESW